MSNIDPNELITDLVLLKALHAAHYAHYSEYTQTQPPEFDTMPDNAKAYWVALAQTAMAYVNVAYAQGLGDGISEAAAAEALALGDHTDPTLSAHIKALNDG